MSELASESMSQRPRSADRAQRGSAMSMINDRPGRRGRLALLVAGLLVAAAIVVLGTAIGFLGAAPAPGPVGAFATVAVLAGLVAGWSAQARRSSTGVLVAAAWWRRSGRRSCSACSRCCSCSAGSRRVPSAGSSGPPGSRSSSQPPARARSPAAPRAGTRAVLHAVRRSPDELLADFAESAGRGSPVDDLLRTLAESMRRDWQLSRVEVWTGPTTRSAAPPARRPGRPRDPGLRRTLVVPSPLDPEPTRARPRSAPAELGMLAPAGRRRARAGCGCGCPGCSSAPATRARRRPAAAVRARPARRRGARAGGHRAARGRAAVHHRGRPGAGRGRPPAGDRAAQPQPGRGAAGDAGRPAAGERRPAGVPTPARDHGRRRAPADRARPARRRPAAPRGARGRHPAGPRQPRPGPRPRTSSCSTSSTAASASRSPRCATWRTGSTRRCCATPAWRGAAGGGEAQPARRHGPAATAWAATRSR